MSGVDWIGLLKRKCHCRVYLVSRYSYYQLTVTRARSEWDRGGGMTSMNQQLTTADTINDCELIKMRHVTDRQTVLGDSQTYL